jgi:hypothetical protein
MPTATHTRSADLVTSYGTSGAVGYAVLSDGMNWQKNSTSVL